MRTSLWLAVAAIVVGGAAGARHAHRGEDRVVVHVAYEGLGFDAMATGAGAILVGQVTRVSPTLWNQDDGTYWEETVVDAPGLETIETALPYYEIELLVGDPLVDEVGLADAIGAGRPVVLTAIGMNDPHDAATAGDGAATTGEDELPIAVGDTVVAFAEPSRMAWRRGGDRPILQLMGNPAHATIGLTPGGTLDTTALPMDAPDTLEGLKDRILELREGRSTD